MKTKYIVIIAILIILFCLFYNKTEYFQSNDLGKLPACFKTIHQEIGEREVADKFTNPNASVLEFGGGSGNVSIIVQKKLKNKSNHVVIQPIEGEDSEKPMFGGLDNLKINKESCNSKFHIIDHVLKPGEGKDILKLVSKPFDTIICDCEGCLFEEYKKNPELFKYVKMIQVERDDRKIEKNSYKQGKYDPLFKILNMKLLYKGDGCDNKRACDTDVWIKK